MAIYEKVNLDFFLQNGFFRSRNLCNELKKRLGEMEYHFYPKLSELTFEDKKEDDGNKYFIITEDFIHEVIRDKDSYNYSIERFNLSDIHSVYNKVSNDDRELQIKLRNGKEFHFNNQEDCTEYWKAEFGNMIDDITRKFIFNT